MKFTGHALDLRNEYACLFAGIECVFQFRGRVTPESVEVKGLSYTMNARIGATATMNHHRLFKDTREARPKFTFNGVSVILNLPAHVV